MTDLKPEVLKSLYYNSFRTGDFTLSSGTKSKYYVNCRNFLSNPINRWMISRLIIRELVPIPNTFNYDYIGGPATGAMPLIFSLSDLLYFRENRIVKTFYTRGKKDHGISTNIEGGDIKEGSKALLIDDVITSGESLADTFAIGISNGLNITDAICIVLRDQKIKKTIWCGKHHLDIHYLFTLDDLIKLDEKYKNDSLENLITL